MAHIVDLKGKRGLIYGVANHRSIAWAIAQVAAKAGCRLAFTYRNEKGLKRLQGLTQDLENPLLISCDITNDHQIKKVYEVIAKEFGSLDYLVHSVAFAMKEDLQGEFKDTSRQGFHTALDVSAYSLIPIAKHAVPLMEESNGGSIITLTYYGSEKVIPSYNVMGTAKAALEQEVRQLAYELGEKNIRVNAISAGPVKTLSARGIPGFNKILEVYEKRSPLRRNITVEEIARTALYLLSDLSTGVTGEIIHVDAGYHILGV